MLIIIFIFTYIHIYQQEANLFKSITKVLEALVIISSSKIYYYVGKMIRRSGHMIFLKEIRTSISNNGRVGFQINSSL